MAKPLILISNDDGVNAGGCVALREALAEIADVVTVAPKTEQSAKSHAISLHHPLRHARLGPGVHSVDGTPVDCVYVALFRDDLLPRKPDLICSGINHGPNLASDVHYSGTVAAAREGALRGIPAIAFSAVTSKPDMKAAAALARQIVSRFLEATLPEDQAPLLNVNIPNGATEFRATRLGLRHYEEGVSVRDDPRGREYYWIGGPGGVSHAPSDGSDTDAVDAGFVSITALNLEATRPEHFGLAAWAAGASD